MLKGTADMLKERRWRLEEINRWEIRAGELKENSHDFLGSLMDHSYSNSDLHPNPF